MTQVPKNPTGPASEGSSPEGSAVEEVAVRMKEKLNLSKSRLDCGAFFYGSAFESEIREKLLHALNTIADSHFDRHTVIHAAYPPEQDGGISIVHEHSGGSKLCRYIYYPDTDEVLPNNHGNLPGEIVYILSAETASSLREVRYVASNYVGVFGRKHGILPFVFSTSGMVYSASRQRGRTQKDICYPVRGGAVCKEDAGEVIDMRWVVANGMDGILDLVSGACHKTPDASKIVSIGAIDGNIWSQQNQEYIRGCIVKTEQQGSYVFDTNQGYLDAHTLSNKELFIWQSGEQIDGNTLLFS